VPATGDGTVYPLPTSQPLPSRESPGGTSPTPTASATPNARTFIGTADVNAAAAKFRLVQLADEIISLLASDPQATVRVSVEITAEFPSGVSDQIKRAVSENATSLGFKNKMWE